MNDIKRVVMVVGAGRSLGEFLVGHMAKEGYNVVVADINFENAAKVAEKIGLEVAFPVRVDATSEEEIREMMEKVDERFGRLDVMIYNAGVAEASKIVDFKLEVFKKVLEINLTGYFLCAREAARMMIKKDIKGSIIQINSKSGKVGSKHNTAYSAAKFGGVGLTQSLALDLAENGIRVNSMMLGNLLDSDMFESLIPQYAKKIGIAESEVKQHYIDKVPLKRGCSFQDVADVVTFYISDKAAYCTGQSINITGGQVMH